jgi:hypothetical protein
MPAIGLTMKPIVLTEDAKASDIKSTLKYLEKKNKKFKEKLRFIDRRLCTSFVHH